MLMSELKPFAAEYFATLVKDTGLRDYFSNAFDAWGERESRYDSAGAGYKVVIDTYADAINVAIARNLAIQADETRTGGTTVTRKGTDKTDTKNERTTDSGERTSTGYAYPTGYTEEPDEAYIATQAKDEAVIDRENNTGNTTVTHDTTDTTETSDIDNSVRASLLDPNTAAAAHKLIRACVFDMVANQVEGCL